jgi:hypothetical protein
MHVEVRKTAVSLVLAGLAACDPMRVATLRLTPAAPSAAVADAAAAMVGRIAERHGLTARTPTNTVAYCRRQWGASIRAAYDGSPPRDVYLRVCAGPAKRGRFQVTLTEVITNRYSTQGLALRRELADSLGTLGPVASDP